MCLSPRELVPSERLRTSGAASATATGALSLTLSVSCDGSGRAKGELIEDRG